MLKFLKSLIPLIDALASEVPEIRAEAHALAEALRRYVGEDVNVGPGGGIDPG
jgi:hypothetical protein